MKLLLDKNLSRRLVPALQARFPGSSQVALLGLEQATDAQICEHACPARLCGLFQGRRLSAAGGGARLQPRLVLLALGNVGNDAVLVALLAAAERLQQAFDDPATGVVVIG